MIIINIAVYTLAKGTSKADLFIDPQPVKRLAARPAEEVLEASQPFGM